MPGSGVFDFEDGDIVQLSPRKERHARMGWVNIGVHAVQLMLDRDGNLTVEAYARTEETKAIQSIAVSHQQAVDAGGVDRDCNWPMTDANKLLAHLVSKYPSLNPHFADKAATAYVDNTAMPPQLIAVEVDEIEIVDPFLSDCGRFEVSPKEAYGIDEEDAQYIRDINWIGTESDEDTEQSSWSGSAPGA